MTIIAHSSSTRRLQQGRLAQRFGSTRPENEPGRSISFVLSFRVIHNLGARRGSIELLKAWNPKAQYLHSPVVR